MESTLRGKATNIASGGSRAQSIPGFTEHWKAFRENKLSAEFFRFCPGQPTYGLDDQDLILGEDNLRKTNSRKN
jgi:hypothetical protein